MIEEQQTERSAADDVLGSVDVPRGLLIGGEWVEASSGETLGVVDPSSGREVARVACAGAEDVDRAVAAAREAFEDGA